VQGPAVESFLLTEKEGLPSQTRRPGRGTNLHRDRRPGAGDLEEFGAKGRLRTAPGGSDKGEHFLTS